MDVRIRYWFQDTIEIGMWCVSGAMPVDTAKKVIAARIYESAEIVLDEEGCPRCEDE